MNKAKWIILNQRLQMLDHRYFDTSEEARKYLEKKYANNPMAQRQFFVAEKSRYGWWDMKQKLQKPPAGLCLRYEVLYEKEQKT